MTQLLGIAMLLTLPAPQQQNLPDAFYELPEQVRERATLIVTGTYGEGRSPCIFMPDGTRVWYLISSIRITKVYRGEVGGKFIYLNKSSLQETKADTVQLTQDHKYLALLRPSAESMKAIRAGEYVPVWDALGDEEIIAIVELK
jgi:hypothetical protein